MNTFAKTLSFWSLVWLGPLALVKPAFAAESLSQGAFLGWHMVWLLFGWILVLFWRSAEARPAQEEGRGEPGS